MDILNCPWEPAKFIVLSNNVPTLFYYSHGLAILAALSLSLFLFFKKKNMLNSIFLFVNACFSFWVFFDLITWSSNKNNTILFFWLIIILLELLVYAGSFYFAFVFFENKDLSIRSKSILLTFLLPVMFLLPTKYILTETNAMTCIPVESKFIIYYSYIFEIGILLAIIFSFIKNFRNEKDDIRRGRIMWFAIGIIVFLLAFSSGNIVGSFTENWNMAQFGLFGMPIFIGFLAYIIVRYKAFNTKLLGAQALVAILSILIGALFLYVTESVGKILILINLALALGFGYILVKSVKKEVEQKEALEVANKEITERKEELQKMADSLSITNEKLKITYDKLEELDRAKADFISLANHQLKHAPTTIKSFLGMFLDGDYGQVPDNQAVILKNINDANDRQIHLADDLLQIIKMESNKVQLDFQKQRVEDVCQGVFDNLSATAKERNLKLSYEKPSQSLPEVLFDKNKVFEAIFNFVDNAVKYTKEGGITIKVKFAPSSNYKPQNSDDLDKKPIQGSVVRVVVSDTGNGISKEHLGQLFAKFSRKDTANLNSGGTGLGLYLVKLMIEAHGGRTWAESEGEGKGSSFIMELPVETPEEILKQIENKE